MEPAKIDWKKLEWNFVEDELYEHINAPKWVDFLSLDHHHVDDQAWFCRPDCKHPTKAEDFLRSATPSKAASENLPFDDQNRRDAKIKRRVPALSSASPPDGKSRFNQDNENQNPDLFSPPMNLLKSMKAAIKSSEEKKKPADNTLQDNKVLPLRSTLSTKNLFVGRPILNQITEFCNELKKLALRAREREKAEDLSSVKIDEEVEEEKAPSLVQAFRDRKEKERKPLLEVGKAERLEGTGVKGKQLRKKRTDEAENVPVSLDLENLKHKRDGSLQQIRTNPPSPQCFSAARGPNKVTPSKTSKSQRIDRGILQEVEKNKETASNESPTTTDNNNSRSRSNVIVDGRETTKALDMLWFLKPCTLSS